MTMMLATMKNHAALAVVCSLLSICHALDEQLLARELAKPWLMRNVSIGDATWPITPASIITALFVLVNLYYVFFGGSGGRWAEASHILIKDLNSKKMLLEMKEEIHDDLKRFQGFAEKYSQCPSKTQKGDLGRFKPGDMAPPFDKAVFQPSSPLETTIGPIQTQFGYHLIYIRERKI